MKIDFSEVTELEAKSAEEGIQTLTIVKVKEEVSSNGTNMLVLDMKDEQEGFVRDRVCTEGKGAFRLRQLLKALGISEEDAEAMSPTDFIGLSVTADIVIEPYEGKDFAKVSKYLI